MCGRREPLYRHQRGFGHLHGRNRRALRPAELRPHVQHVWLHYHRHRTPTGTIGATTGVSGSYTSKEHFRLTADIVSHHK